MGLSYVKDVHLELQDNIPEDVHFVVETAFVEGIVSVESSRHEPVGVDNIPYIYMFVVSGHLYRPLLLSQSWKLGGKILGGFGTHPLKFFGAGLSILVFI